MAASTSPPVDVPPAVDQTPITRPTAVVLQWGFRVSAGFLLLGIVLIVAQGRGLPHSLVGVPSLVRLALDGDGRGFLGFGILVMLATPIVSTLNVALACLRRGDRRYAVVTGLVLVILIVSALLSAT